MIPKKIHYCWFGRNPLPESAKKCIASWRKFLPDYEIIEWNEDNFDVHSIPYTAQAYSVGKYAFVSDYARFKILYEHGGLYFDTDVEVIRPMDDIVAAGPFMGFEIDAADPSVGVNPGLGLGAFPGMDFFKTILAKYGSFNFLKSDGSLNETTIVTYTTGLLEENGLAGTAGLQNVMGLNLYPAEYFNPLDNNTGRLKISENTRSIHWYAKTWYDCSPWRMRLSRLLHRLFGTELPGKIRRFFANK